MIAYFPEPYPDELLYSWISRYYAHSGIPCYSMALGDILANKHCRINYEFTGPFNDEAKAIINKIIPFNELILDHTMFAYYGRFCPSERRIKAFNALLNGQSINKLLPIPTNAEARFLRYCPVCAAEDRRTYGEMYLHCTHQIRHINICPSHGSLLRSTNIRITANSSPRLFVVEEIVPHGDVPEIHFNSSEMDLARYIANVFRQPMNMTNTASIGDYLTYRLGGTPYIIGDMRQVVRLHRDMAERYAAFPYQEHNIQKVLLGNSFEPHLIMLIAYHLGITPQELSNGVIPCTSTIIEHQRTRARSSHSTRKGQHTQNWCKLDRDCLPKVRNAIKMLLIDSNNRPRRVTERAVCQQMNWPSKRLEHLPMCKAEVRRYYETTPQYWTREIVWAYKQIQEHKDKLNWRAIRDLTNIRRRDFEIAKPLLIHYADAATCNIIRSL